MSKFSSRRQVKFFALKHPLATVCLIIACKAGLIGREFLPARGLPHRHGTQYAGASLNRRAPAPDRIRCLEQLSVGDAPRAIRFAETAILPQQPRRLHAAQSSDPMSLDPLDMPRHPDLGSHPDPPGSQTL